MGGLWAIGAALSVIGSICSNLGVNVQKYSFMANEKKPIHEQKPYRKQPTWVGGLLLVIFGSLGDFAALALAAQSIVAPIGSVTLVANLFFAHYWLKEKLGKRDIIGTSMIIAGSTIAVAFGDHTEVSYTLDVLKSYYTRDLFVAYGVIACVVIASLYLFVRKAQPIKIQLNAAIKQYDEAVCKGDKGLQAFQDEAIAALEKKYEPYEKFHPFGYCALSGIFGGQSILFGKMVAELARQSFSGDNQMKYGLTYVFLLLMLITIFSQLHFLAIALSFFDALYVVPVFQCFFITVSTLGGACYFYEFSRFHALQWIMFPLGLCGTLAGVYLLSARSMRRTISRNRMQDGPLASDEDQVIELAENGEPPLPRVAEEDEFSDRSAAPTPTNAAGAYSRVNVSSAELIMDTSSPSSNRHVSVTATPNNQAAVVAAANARRPRPPITGRVSDKVIQDEATAAAGAISALVESPYLVNSESGDHLLAHAPGGDKSRPANHPQLQELTFTDQTNGTSGPMTPQLPGQAPRSPNVPHSNAFKNTKKPRPPSAPRTQSASVSAPTTPNIPNPLVSPAAGRKSMAARQPVMPVEATSILTIAPPFALAITAALPKNKRASHPQPQPEPVHPTNVAQAARQFLFQLPERLPPWSSFNVANYASTTHAHVDMDHMAEKDKMDVPILHGHGLIIDDDGYQSDGKRPGNKTPTHGTSAAAAALNGDAKDTPPRTAPHTPQNALASPPGSAGPNGRTLQSRYARRRLTKTNLFESVEGETTPLAPGAATATGTTATSVPATANGAGIAAAVAAATAGANTPSHASISTPGATATTGGTHFFPSTSQHSSTTSLNGVLPPIDHHHHHMSMAHNPLSHHSHTPPATAGSKDNSPLTGPSQPHVAAPSHHSLTVHAPPPVPASPTTVAQPVSPIPAPSKLDISMRSGSGPQSMLTSDIADELDGGEQPLVAAATRHFMPTSASTASVAPTHGQDAV